MGSHVVHRAVVNSRVAATLLFCMSLARPGFAQIELAGSWVPTRGEVSVSDAVPTDYTGVPLSEEGRTKALSYSESQLGMIERQCQGWPNIYLAQGPFGMKIWSDTDQMKGTVTSWTIGAWEDRPAMVIWMDGRPHPSEYVEHTRAGFTTGRWEGNTLTARTTHQKAGFFKRNGVPSSDLTTMITTFIRHGDLLTLVMVAADPIYLEEPLILTKSYQLSASPVSATGPPCITTFEGTVENTVPHYIPEENPFIDEMTAKYGIPREAALGGAQTLYPEYRRKLQSTPVR